MENKFTKLVCTQCKKERSVNLSKSNIEKYKLQHPICQKCRTLNVTDKISRTWFKKGEISWNKGLRREFRGKSKDGLHDWVERNLGKAKEGICIKCNSDKNLQWSNISNEYKKDLTDWQILCTKCHQRYDFEQTNAREVFYT